MITTVNYGQIVKKTSSVKPINGRSFKASYYCISGRTASGMMTRSGIVAADPRVFPLGTRILIDGKSYLVADTGGAIRGNRLDIWVSSCSLARKLGMKNVQVQRL